MCASVCVLCVKCDSLGCHGAPGFETVEGNLYGHSIGCLSFKSVYCYFSRLYIQPFHVELFWAFMIHHDVSPYV